MFVDGENDLGNNQFGVVVYEVVEGDSALKDMCISWPIHLLFRKDVSVYDHLRQHASIAHEEEMRKLDRIGKRKYDTSNRPHTMKKTQHWRIGDEEIAKLYMEECCHRYCVRMFPPTVVRSLRQEMFLKDPEQKRLKNLDIHRMKFQSVDGKEVLVKLEFKEVCIKGWKLIHGVSSRTFRRYDKQAGDGERG